MQQTWMLTAAPAALFLLGAIAQQSGDAQPSRAQAPAPTSRPLSPLQPGDPLSHTGLQGPTFQEAEWMGRLTDSDLNARMDAYEELASGLAQKGSALRALERWASGSDELAWTSRMLLREARRPLDPLGRMRARLDDLHTGRLGGIFGRLPRPRSPFDNGFDHGMFEDLFQGTTHGAQSSSVQVTESPDGIRVEVTETVDGEEVSEVYEASSRKELLRQHPELEGKLGSAATGLRAFSFPFRSQAPSPFPKDRLGVYLRAEVGVLGAPLTVESVAAGSLAEELGIRAGDELVELNGHRLTDQEDIAEALRARVEGEGHRLTIVDGKGDLRELFQNR